MGGTISLPATFSVEDGSAAVAGQGIARRTTSAAPPTESKFGPEVDTLFKLFERSANLHPDSNCMGKRNGTPGDGSPFEWISYKTVLDKILTVGSGVADLGLKASDTFGMYATNSQDWQICALGAMSQGLTCVPIYDTLGDDIVRYEINHADVKAIFVEASKLGAVASVLDKCPTLVHVIMVGDVSKATAEAKAAFTEGGAVKLHELSAVIAAGVAKPVAVNPGNGDATAYIMYTSGTTGDPKGVTLTQKALTIAASYCVGLTLLPSDTYLSFLPLAHIMETVVEYGMWSSGGAVGYYSGNIKFLLDDIMALKPTIFAGVPRVYQRFYEKAYAAIAGFKGLKKSLLTSALTAEIAACKNGGHANIVYKKLARALGAKITGGNVRLMVSGAAPLPSHVQEFLLAAIGCPVVQGYGMTENAANSTMAALADYRSGHVGPPVPTVDIKLIDVPEMNYTSALVDADGAVKCATGEVMVKGPTVFSGYHKNEAATKETIEPDGWMHTGDIGRWNADGTLSIIDRKKNIFKLAQGEYVAAEKIEMCVSKSKYISQPWVYGNSFLNNLVAVVTPDYDELHAAAKAAGWDVESNAALAETAQAKEFIMSEMKRECTEAKLKSFEFPKVVHLESTLNDLNQGFSIENDCLTPTFKLKRPSMLKKYQETIDALYKSIGEDTAISKNQ